jgi:Domain of unknown function (DUF4440)
MHTRVYWMDELLAGRAGVVLTACVVLGLGGCAGIGGARAAADAAAVPGSGASATGVVEGVERERFAAMMAVDRAKLERLLAESLKYCHSNGRCETKAEFIGNLVSGQMKYRSIQVLEIQPRAVGNAMLVQGRLAIEAEQAGQPLAMQLVYTDVYESRGGVWQLVAWQSTRLP